MRQYQWMFPIALVFCSLGGYLLSTSFIAGGLLILMGIVTLIYKWKLQDPNCTKSDEVKG